jgi:hypothetical protein
MDKILTENATLFRSYLHWAFAKEQAEPIAPGSRPPVGRFAPRPSNGNNSRQHGNSFDSKQDKKSHRSSKKNHRSNDNNNRRNFNNKQNRFSNNNSNNNNNKPDFNSEEHQVRQEQALKECDVAIEKLNTNSDLDKILLDPQNSFFRRLQHERIKEKGFFSESSGDGKKRSVVVSRNNKES